MSRSMRLKVYSLAALTLLSLAACHDSNKDDLLTSGTANEIAIRQIEKATCDEKAPQDLTDVTVRESDDAVDVSRVEPDCS